MELSWERRFSRSAARVLRKQTLPVASPEDSGLVKIRFWRLLIVPWCAFVSRSLNFKGSRSRCDLGYKAFPTMPFNLLPPCSLHTIRAKRLMRKHLSLRVISLQLPAMLPQIIFSLLMQHATAQLGDILSYKLQRYSECGSLLSTCQPTISSSLFLYKFMLSYIFPMRSA
jgi:hypothetical protein